MKNYDRAQAHVHKASGPVGLLVLVRALLPTSTDLPIRVKFGSQLWKLHRIHRSLASGKCPLFFPRDFCCFIGWKGLVLSSGQIRWSVSYLPSGQRFSVNRKEVIRFGLMRCGETTRRSQGGWKKALFHLPSACFHASSRIRLPSKLPPCCNPSWL